jgi:hypothetical protein
MYPCSACSRHLRASEALCPFCGAEQHSQIAPVSTLGGFALAAATVIVFGCSACAPPPPASDDGMTTTTVGGSGSGTESTTESDSEAETTAGDGDGDMIVFVPNMDASAYASVCHPFWQDCPEGEKCVAYASSGEQLDSTRCVPVFGDGQPGEPCTFDGPIQATDDCDETSHCFQIEEIDAVLQGICTPFCGGTPDEPQCDPGTTCYLDYDESLNLCLSQCDPLAQDCPPGQLCGWAGWDFACVIERAAPPANGEPCDGHVDACSLGETCIPAAASPGCVGAACCTEFCDRSDPNFACTDPELSCESFFEQDAAPPGWELVGVCANTPP